MRRRRLFVLFLGLSATPACIAAGAYACVPQPFITIHPVASAVAGSQVTVDGQLFPTGSRIEIRWNATDGPLLGTADARDFSVPVAIPSAPPGLYTVLAISRNAAGVQGEVARSEFQVLGGGATPTSAPGTARAARTGESVSFTSVAAAVGLVAVGIIGGALLGRGRRAKPAPMPGPGAPPGR